MVYFISFLISSNHPKSNISGSFFCIIQDNEHAITVVIYIKGSFKLLRFFQHAFALLEKAGLGDLGQSSIVFIASNTSRPPPNPTLREKIFKI